MSPSFLRASWWVVRRPGLVVPVALAVVLVAATWPALDAHGLLVLRGVGVILACAWVVALDDPLGEVLAASPYPRPVRWGTRVLLVLAVLVPTWAAAAVLVEQRTSSVPVLAVGLEALGLGVTGLVLAATVRTWRGQLEPSYVAVAGVLVLAVVSDALPRRWALVQDQTWGPPWEAAHVRWAAVLLVAFCLLTMLLRDPLARRSGGAAGRPVPVGYGEPPGRDGTVLGECPGRTGPGRPRGSARRRPPRSRAA